MRKYLEGWKEYSEVDGRREESRLGKAVLALRVKGLRHLAVSEA